MFAQRVFSHHLVLALAQQQADGGRVLRVLDLGVHGGEIEAQLAQVFGFELAALELDHHIAAQFEVIEQQVDEELVAAHVQQHLPAHECKTGSQFQQKLGDVFDQGAFDLALLRHIGAEGEAVAADLRQSLLGRFGIAIDDRDRSTGRSEQFGAGQADSAGAAGHDGNLAVEQTFVRVQNRSPPVARAVVPWRS